MGPPSLRWTLIQRHMTQVQARRTVFMTANPTRWYQGGVSLAKDARDPQSTNRRSTSWDQNPAWMNPSVVRNRRRMTYSNAMSWVTAPPASTVTVASDSPSTSCQAFRV